jgi:hypothetical protein
MENKKEVESVKVADLWAIRWLSTTNFLADSYGLP